MVFFQVLIEHATLKLNRPFTYRYEGPLHPVPGIRVLIPFRQSQVVGYVIAVDERCPEGLTVDKVLSVIKVIDHAPLLTEELMTLSQTLANQLLVSHIGLLQSMLPKTLKPSSTSLKGPKTAYETSVSIAEGSHEGLTLKQREFLQLFEGQKQIAVRDIKQKSILKTLLEKGVLIPIKQETYRLKFDGMLPKESLVLTAPQQEAVETILKGSEATYLLHGVTGSGKTEVYVQLVKQMLARGKSAIIIVPEIALTPRMVAYFYGHFGQQVAVLHSELTSGEKYDEYRRISEGKARVVIGARSAIFAPLSTIGLIVVDEEHAESYKQDHPPFYHARDIALLRCEYHRAKLVLGSATPSLESFARGLKKVYRLVELKQRIFQQEQPSTAIVDMSDPGQFSSESPLFSKRLIAAIRDRIANHEQIILLLNRRGFAASMVCRHCGFTPRCQTCKIPLTYHQKNAVLKCHYCDHIEEIPSVCPECNGRYFIKTGFGTQRVEDDVLKIFPGVKTARLDTDTTQLRNSVGKTLAAFEKGEVDILIGTQMVAKGHDFENVTLVGVVLADIGLSIPSYRSSERTFQLLSQVIGRTGRGRKKGEAIIQTFNPNHFAITCGAKQDYLSFFSEEMRQRKLGGYPPYRFVVSIELGAKEEPFLAELATSVSDVILEKKLPNLDVIGPQTPYVAWQQGWFKRRIILKYKSYGDIAETMKEIYGLFALKHNVQFAINFDPYDI